MAVGFRKMDLLAIWEIMYMKKKAVNAWFLLAVQHSLSYPTETSQQPSV